MQMDLQVKNFDFSVKNIPIPSKYAYKKRLIQKAESLIRRMRWKANDYCNGLKGKKMVSEKKYHSLFKSDYAPP